MYTEQQLVRIAKRENNTKRTYLVVNCLQGKHIPVCPGEAFQMFWELAEKVKERYEKERLLLVGFAETATAIGAVLAVELGTFYIQTTREEIAGADYLYFSESHSHATEQKLVRQDMDEVMGKVDRVVFVEDEVTTGNTILHIIDLLEREYPGRAAFAVASLLNGMNEESQKKYRDRGIPVEYLVKTDHALYGEMAERYKGDGVYHLADETPQAESVGAKEQQEGGMRMIELGIPGAVNARRCVCADYYRDSCEKLWIEVQKRAGLVDKQQILVLGTEEFMYPALYIGRKLEEQGKTIRCHATTRSPIAVSSEEEYPLHTRYELKSLYDEERKTFIYDLEQYECVLVVTDAKKGEEKGVSTLRNALARCRNTEMVLVRWCEV